MWKKIKTYVISIATALLTGGLSALLTMGNMDIYSRINQPPLAPPPWLFPVVWTILYVLMGIGAALVYNRKDYKPNEVRTALIIYAVNLFLNFFWSIIFFNLEAYLFAFIWLVVLWGVIIAMIVSFRKVSPAAAYMQIPYLIWVTFAGYLNFAIYLLNR
ncbi:MAG: tryptophan-rich sensory protein [Clostridia bacterium]|nr:tryptophan-rich sensory protein [Clostridia bacterium]